MRRGSVDDVKGDHSETGLRSAICVYLIAERPDGATVNELAHLQLGGRLPAEEVARVTEAVSQLVHQGEVAMAGEKVVPV